MSNVPGLAPGDQCGFSVDVLDDVDADGFAELVIGEPFASGAGRVRVISGANGSVLHVVLGNASSDETGYSVSASQDVDGDGVPDFVVGSPGVGALFGAARVHSGLDGSLVHDITSVVGQGRLGRAVAGIGDMNGNGLGDFAVERVGLIRYFDGSGAEFWPRGGSGAACDVVASAGDADGDGDDEVVCGFPLTLTGVATVRRLRLGLMGTPAVEVYLVLPGPNGAFPGIGDRFGSGVTGIGDVNADGCSDIMSGAPRDDDAGLDSGSVTVFSGCDGSVIHFVLGAMAGQQFGFAGAGRGDVNGDGCPDFAVGSPSDPTGGVDGGSVHVYSGVDATLVGVVTGQPGDRLGYSVAMGDVNGDGFAEVVAGAPGFDDDRGITRVFSLCGVSAYGENADPAQTLTLAWTPGAGPPLTSGSVAVTGGGPGEFGFAVVSTDRSAIPLAGVTILVDPTPGQIFVSDVFDFDAAGTVSFPVDLVQPPLVGFTLALQGFEVNGSAPGNLFASNGLEVLFCQ